MIWLMALFLQFSFAQPAQLSAGPEGQQAPLGQQVPTVQQAPAGQEVSEAPKDTVIQDTAGGATTTVTPLTDSLVYDIYSGRDPFQRPFFKDANAVSLDPNSLEDVILPEGVMVIAIAYNPKNPRALILKLSDKKTYTAFVGTRIGFLGGTVESISEDTVTVKQQVEVSGRLETVRVPLTFKKYQNRN